MAGAAVIDYPLAQIGKMFLPGFFYGRCWRWSCLDGNMARIFR